MSLSILSATIRNNGTIELINLQDMTKELFRKYREVLYCPNRDCNARIEFASGPKRTYFRTKRSIVDGTEIIEQHNPDCIYAVEHDNQLGTRGRYDPSILVSISEKHMNDVLKRAYRKYRNRDKDEDDQGNVSKGHTKSKSTQSKKDDNVITRGRPTFSILGEDEANPNKQPPLFQRNINEITERDYGQIRTVNGIMEDFVVESNYKYITLKTADGRKGRVLFGEIFNRENNAQYTQIDVYKNYFIEQSKKGNEVFVVCLGEVTRDDYDVSVVMYNYRGINIDGKSHYEILKLNR